MHPRERPRGYGCCGLSAPTIFLVWALVLGLPGFGLSMWNIKRAGSIYKRLRIESDDGVTSAGEGDVVYVYRRPQEDHNEPRIGDYDRSRTESFHDDFAENESDSKSNDSHLRRIQRFWLLTVTLVGIIALLVVILLAGLGLGDASIHQILSRARQVKDTCLYSSCCPRGGRRRNPIEEFKRGRKSYSSADWAKRAQTV